MKGFTQDDCVTVTIKEGYKIVAVNHPEAN